MYYNNDKRMFGGQKKKRNSSGTRSKSRKLKESIDLKPKQVTCNLHQTKSRVEDYSLHPLSKPKRKLSKSKKHTKSSAKDSKEISHSVSADRKYSQAKVNRTEADPQDIGKQMNSFKKTLSTIPRGQYMTIPQLEKYYKLIFDASSFVTEPIGSVLHFLHQMYVRPLQSIFSLYGPYEQILREEKELVQLIRKQSIQNEQLQKKLDPIDADILKYKNIVEQQRALIDQKKKQIQLRVHEQSLKEVKGFKLDLRGVQNRSIMGFQDQFYSKIDEFSESWRNQALRQKKF